MSRDLTQEIILEDWVIRLISQKHVLPCPRMGVLCNAFQHFMILSSEYRKQMFTLVSRQLKYECRKKGLSWNQAPTLKAGLRKQSFHVNGILDYNAPNALARVVAADSSDAKLSARRLALLHWLPIQQRISFKLCT